MTHEYPVLFKSLVQALPIPILIVNRALTILDANEAALHMAGRQGALVGQTLEQAFADKRISALAQASV